MAKLIISADGRDKVYEIIDERFTIGSGPDADLQLRSDGVSGIHLTVDKTKSGYRLIDMETKDGTIVNGKQSNQHVLANGDTIEIGAVKITYMGKGPARAGADSRSRSKKGNGRKLESSNYYRHAHKESMSSGARFAMIGGIILGVVAVLWIGLNATQPPRADFNRAELNEAIRMCKQGTSEEEVIIETINKFRNKKLNSEEEALFTRLIQDWEVAKESAQTGQKSKKGRSAWMAIHNTQMTEPNNREKLTTLCEDFVAEYSDVPGVVQQYIKSANNILKEMADLGEMSDDEKEIARVQGLVRVAMSKKDHHEAMRGLLSMESSVRAAQQEVYEKIERRIRMKSRQFLGVRKNDVREFLRADKYDPAKARKIAVDMIFKKLVFTAIDAYLDSPDHYELPKNQLAEEKTQALLRELLKEMKPGY
ncbi:MAG: hypothetical protein ACI97A_002266 [Planctomycetota bacterium]|jgi:hypothetical protein